MSGTKRIKIRLISLTSPSHPIAVNPLAVTTLSAYLQKVFGDEIDIAVRCSLFEPVSKIIAAIDHERPDIIGFSLQMGTYELMEGCMKKLEDILPGWQTQPLIILGNVIATFAAKILLKNYPDVLVVVGEGEYALEGIVRQVLEGEYDFKDVPNLAYIKEGKIVENIRIPFNLDKLVAPAFDYMERVVEDEGHVWIEASRGCNSRCIFCSRYPVRMTKWTPISAGKVLAVILQLRAKFGIRHFRFSDDDFLGTGSDRGMIHAREIAKGVMERGLNITFDISAQVRAVYSDKEEAADNIKKEETFKLLRKAGLTQVFLGVESGSCGQLKRFAKPASVDENLKAIDKLHALGIQVVVGFIMLDYLMKIEELEENIEFVKKVGALKLEKRIFISDFLVTLRAQEGSPFLRLLSQNRLLQNADTQHLTYNASYQDARIEKIAKMIEIWRREDFVLVYILKNRVSKLSLENVVCPERRTLEQLLHKLKVLDFEYLVELVQSVKMNQNIQELSEGFILKRLSLVERLRLEISATGRKDNSTFYNEIDRFIHDAKFRISYAGSTV